ncbi:MAG: DEAD/DEAH box helicase [Bdellovibrionota bacterium]
MGFRGKNKNTYRPKPPKQPIRLAFGLIEDKSQASTEYTAPVPYQFEKQEIIGTLVLKKINYEKAKPLPEKHIQRVIKNIAKIYEEGRYLNTNTIIDADIESDITLKVSFNFNQNVIDRIKGLDRNERQWDQENKLWRVFIGCFDDLFDIVGRGFKLTDSAYELIKTFIHSKYYAAIAPGKLGKLILRESMFEEFDLNSSLPQHVSVVPGSTAFYHSKLTSEQSEKLSAIQKQIANFKFKRKPYSHQTVGIEFIMQNATCALLDEMGCGKSFQIATSIALLLENKSIEKCLIVAPKSLIRTWKEELSLATEIPFTIIEGAPALREKLLKSENKIFIIHYEGVRLEKEKLAQWIDSGNSMVVFDESQRIKNLNAQTTISSKFVRNNAKRCVIATGTPIANRPIDLFAQYYVMDNGETFGSNFSAFKNTFCHIEILEITQGRKKIKIEKFLGVKNGDDLRKRIQATSLRRLKKEVLDLPPIIAKDYVVELQAEQKSLYAKVRDNIRNEIEHLSEEEYRLQANNIIVRLLRLSQLTSNPILLDGRYEGSNAKIEELDNILNDVFADDTKKIILWSHFVGNVEYLDKKYKETWNSVSHTGEMSIEKRAQSVEDFQNNPECRLFIATPQSAKEGLTLLPRDDKMKADVMIYLDLNFDAGSYIQSQARFHRIGQNTDKCLVIHLIASGTIDEFIRKTIIDKIQTASQILDDASQEALSKLRGETVKFGKQDVVNILN